LDALHVRPKGEGHGCPESKKRTKESAPPMNPPFGSVRSLEKSGPLINFFRIEEIDALHVRPQGEVQGCAESNSLRFTPLRQKLLSTDFPFTRSPGSEGDKDDQKT
jgi:hypothetical protein